MFFAESRIFNNRHLEIVAPSPKNNNPNIFASFLIISKFPFMLCLQITSSSSLDMSFMLGVIYVLETFLHNSSTFLNLIFWGRLKEIPSEKIISAMVIVRQV